MRWLGFDLDIKNIFGLFSLFFQFKGNKNLLKKNNI